MSLEGWGRGGGGEGRGGEGCGGEGRGGEGGRGRGGGRGGMNVIHYSNGPQYLNSSYVTYYVTRALLRLERTMNLLCH